MSASTSNQQSSGWRRAQNEGGCHPKHIYRRQHRWDRSRFPACKWCCAGAYDDAAPSLKVAVIPTAAIENMLAAVDLGRPMPDKLLVPSGWQAPTATVTLVRSHNSLLCTGKSGLLSASGKPLADPELQSCLRGSKEPVHITAHEQAQFCGLIPHMQHRSVINHAQPRLARCAANHLIIDECEVSGCARQYRLLSLQSGHKQTFTCRQCGPLLELTSSCTLATCVKTCSTLPKLCNKRQHSGSAHSRGCMAGSGGASCRLCGQTGRTCCARA